MLVVVATARTDQIAWGFLRLIGLIVFAVACGLTIWHLRAGQLASASAGAWALRLGVGLGVACVAIVFTAPFVGRMGRMFAMICALGGLSGLGAACLSALAGFGGEAQMRLTVMTGIVISQTLGGVLLGSVTIAWLMGHAYLTATKMTIAPLRHFSLMLSWAVAARVVFLVLSVLIAWLIADGSGSSIITQLGRAWLIVLLRVGFGLVAVGVFAYMVSDCVRRRATQSATGILYFGSIFVYIGELANLQLTAECRWPL